MALPDVLQLLLARHRAVLTPPPHALIRADQVMLHGDALPAALGRWVGDRVPGAGNVSRLPLLPGVDVLDLLTDLPSDTAVAPVHLMQAAPRFRGGPAGAAETLDVALPAPPSTGSGRPVTVAVLDTGIARHPWFTDRPWFAEVRGDQFEVLDADHDERLDTLAGHGTFVAGIVLQHAPDARIVVVRLLGSDGVCDEVDLITALHRLPPVDIVNLSLGCHTWDDRPSVALTAAVDALGSAITVVAAAGNDGESRPFWPAALPSVVAVGALNADGTAPAEFSNRGDWVDTAAIGADVRGPFVSLTDDGAAAFARWSGTSFAAPAVSGAIARALARGEPSPHPTRQV
jgi:subtilisin family serine protease